jgi:5-carboxymethyl-2-hydroxymuconate isomerase
MPHLRLEYSADLPAEIAAEELLHELHSTLERIGGIRIGNCKTRVWPASRYLVGNGLGDGAFVHCEVRFLEGRSLGVREAIGARLLDILVRAYGAEQRPDLQITVEVTEIERATYFKHPPGTLTP